MDKPQLHYWMECISCGKKMPHDKNYYICSDCGSLLLPERDEDYIRSKIGEGEKAQAYFDNIRYGSLRKKYPYDSGVFMWLDYILPGFPLEAALSLREGFTDLFEPPEWLKKEIGLNQLFFKMEGQGPSGSFKDRGMSIAVSEVRRLQLYHPELGIKFIACASTGDTSAAAAGYAAYHRDKINCVVFLPYEKISDGQLAQAMMSGATVVAIKHPQGFDACLELIREFCSRHSDYVLVNSANSFRLIGQETIYLEIFQDLRWKAPRWISLPVGNAGNLTALLNACLRAKRTGLIKQLPGIIVGQTQSANTLVRWGRSGFKDYKPGVFKDTVASAMNIRDPLSFPRIKKLIDEFQVLFYDVSEEDIQKTRAKFNRAACDLCPQGAVAMHAALQARDDGLVKKDDLIVVVSTASGLKFVDSAINYHAKSSKESYANPYLVAKTSTVEGIENLLLNK